MSSCRETVALERRVAVTQSCRCSTRTSPEVTRAAETLVRVGMVAAEATAARARRRLDANGKRPPMAQPGVGSIQAARALKGYSREPRRRKGAVAVACRT
jgi:hypothetical protein